MIRLILILILFTLACKPNVVQTIEHQTIPVDLNSEKIANIWELVDNVQFIVLDTNNNGFISRLGTFKSYRNNFYVLDRKKYEVVVFNSSGKCIDRISNLGDHPNGYTTATDIEINPYTGSLELMTANGKIIAYDLQKKTFSALINLKNVLAVHSFRNISEDLIAFYSKTDDNRLTLYSRTQAKVIWADLPNPDLAFKANISLPNFSFATGKMRNHLLDPYSNTIFKIEEDKLLPLISFDLGRFTLHIERVPDLDQDDVFSFINYLERERLAYPLHSYYEDDDMIWLCINVGDNHPKSFIFNKINKKIIYVYVPVDKLFYPVIDEDEKYFYGVIWAPENLEKVFKGHDQLVTAMPRGEQVEGNPIIVRYQLKKVFE